MTSPYVRPDVRAFLDFLLQQNGPKMHEVGHVAAREMMRAMRSLAEVATGEIAVLRDVAMPAPGGGTIPLRVFDPRPSRAPGPALVFFHGGGFVIGDLDVYEPLCAEIARGLDLPVVSVDYRLAPEHKWPSAPDDCEAAARWIADSPDALGLKASSLVLAGDSAGGNLTIVTALALRDVPAAVPVIAQWPIYPAVAEGRDDASMAAFSNDYFLTREGMAWFTRSYASDPAHWRAMPILADQTGLPPTLIVTATLDPLLDQGRAFAAACIKMGVPTIYREAVGNIHGFMTMRKAIPSSQGDLQACLTVLRAMIAEAEANRVMAQADTAPAPVPA